MYISIDQMLQELHRFDKAIMAAVTSEETAELTKDDIEITMFKKTVRIPMNADTYDALYSLVVLLAQLEQGII